MRFRNRQHCLPWHFVILAWALLSASNTFASTKLYLAGPLGFSEAGVYFQDKELVPSLEKAGFQVINPWKLTDAKLFAQVQALPPGDSRKDAWRKLNEQIGRNNATALQSSDIVLAILDGSDVDSGTASEVGAAFSLHKRIFGYRGDFRLASDNEGAAVNLQVEYFISASGGKIFTSFHELIASQGFLALRTSERSKTVEKIGQPGKPDEEAIRHEPQITDAVKDLIEFFRKTIAIVLALAFGEAFKQFVADKEEPAKRIIHYNRLPALLSFLALLLPFFQGINSYLFETYRNAESLFPNYKISLFFDSLMFLVESAFFFIMSRALDPLQWLRLTGCARILMVVDAIWAMAAYLLHSAQIKSWLFLDVVSIVVITVIRNKRLRIGVAGAKSGGNARENPRVSLLGFDLELWPWLFVLFNIIRTTVDYGLAWSHYFP